MSLKCVLGTSGRIVTSQLGRCLSSAVKYTKHGDPTIVLKYEKEDVPSTVGAKDVALKILAAPINPSDINMIEGVYGKKPELPSVGGNECVAEVSAVGSGVTSLKVGDWVIPATVGFGTWREMAVVGEDNLLKVPSNMYDDMVDINEADDERTKLKKELTNNHNRLHNICYASSVSVNPCTAYRLLRDYVTLKEGDVIMQNGANSMVGQAVIQMAREMGVKTINIVRSDRPYCENELRLLTNLGGDICVPDTFVNTTGFRELLKELPACKLAFNCVGGENSTEMIRSLASGATVVTYGGMSKKPFTIPYDVLTQRQITLKGHWMAKWNEEHSKETRTKMIEDIASMIREKQLTFFYEMCDFDDFPHALSQALEPFRLRKLILYMDYPDRFKEHDAIAPERYEKFEAPFVA